MDRKDNHASTQGRNHYYRPVVTHGVDSCLALDYEDESGCVTQAPSVSHSRKWSKPRVPSFKQQTKATTTTAAALSTTATQIPSRPGQLETKPPTGARYRKVFGHIVKDTRKNGCLVGTKMKSYLVIKCADINPEWQWCSLWVKQEYKLPFEEQKKTKKFVGTKDIHIGFVFRTDLLDEYFDVDGCSQPYADFEWHPGGDNEANEEKRQKETRVEAVASCTANQGISRFDSMTWVIPFAGLHMKPIPPLRSTLPIALLHIQRCDDSMQLYSEPLASPGLKLYSRRKINEDLEITLSDIEDLVWSRLQIYSILDKPRKHRYEIDWDSKQYNFQNLLTMTYLLDKRSIALDDLSFRLVHHLQRNGGKDVIEQWRAYELELLKVRLHTSCSYLVPTLLEEQIMYDGCGIKLVDLREVDLVDAAAVQAFFRGRLHGLVVAAPNLPAIPEIGENHCSILDMGSPRTWWLPSKLGASSRRLLGEQGNGIRYALGDISCMIECILWRMKQRYEELTDPIEMNPYTCERNLRLWQQLREQRVLVVGTLRQRRLSPTWGSGSIHHLIASLAFAPRCITDILIHGRHAGHRERGLFFSYCKANGTPVGLALQLLSRSLRHYWTHTSKHDTKTQNEKWNGIVQSAQGMYNSTKHYGYSCGRLYKDGLCAYHAGGVWGTTHCSGRCRADLLVEIEELCPPPSLPSSSSTQGQPSPVLLPPEHVSPIHAPGLFYQLAKSRNAELDNPSIRVRARIEKKWPGITQLLNWQPTPVKTSISCIRTSSSPTALGVPKNTAAANTQHKRPRIELLVEQTPTAL